MRTSILILSAATALGLPQMAAAAPSEFRLPTTPAPAASGDRQGPVVSDVPESRARPAPAPAPTPTPTSAAPPPAAVAPPLVEPEPVPIAPPSVSASTAPAAARPTARSTGAAPVMQLSAAPPSPGLGATVAPTQVVPSPGLGTTVPDVVAPAPAPAEQGGSRWWLWLLGGGVVVAAGAAAAWWALRRPARTAAPVKVPVIERPRVPAPPPPQPAAAVTPVSPPPAVPQAPVAPEPLRLMLEPLKLSLTLMNAALSYRLEVSNSGSRAIEALRIEADMISAHASLPREQQLAGPGQGAPTAHAIERLEPGESRVVEGEFRLPFPQIVPIRQGTVTLLLPLARFRAQAPGTQPVVRTFAVGQPGGAGMQPFRLDQGPRVFPQLVQRAFG